MITNHSQEVKEDESKEDHLAEEPRNRRHLRLGDSAGSAKYEIDRRIHLILKVVG